MNGEKHCLRSRAERRPGLQGLCGAPRNGDGPGRRLHDGLAHRTWTKRRRVTIARPLVSRRPDRCHFHGVRGVPGRRRRAGAAEGASGPTAQGRPPRPEWHLLGSACGHPGAILPGRMGTTIADLAQALGTADAGGRLVSRLPAWQMLGRLAARLLLARFVRILARNSPRP